MSNILKHPNIRLGFAATMLAAGGLAIAGCSPQSETPTSTDTSYPYPGIHADSIKVTSVSENPVDKTISFTSVFPDGTAAIQPTLMCEGGKVVRGTPPEGSINEYSYTGTKQGCEDGVLTLSDKVVEVGDVVGYGETAANQPMIHIR